MNDDRKFQENKPKVLFLFGLSLPIFIVSKVLDLSKSTLQNYYNKVVALGEFKGELLGSNNSGRGLFLLFARLISTGKTLDNDLGLTSRIKDVLYRELDIALIEIYLEGVIKASSSYATIQYDPGIKTGYKSLIADLKIDLKDAYSIKVNFVMLDFWEKVFIGEINLYKRKMNLSAYIFYVRDLIANIEISKRRKIVAPFVSKELIALIDKVIDELKGKRPRVIRSFYGLDSDKKTIKEIASDLSISNTGTRNLYNTAILGLRNSKYKMGIANVFTIAKAHEGILLLKKELLAAEVKRKAAAQRFPELLEESQSSADLLNISLLLPNRDYTIDQLQFLTAKIVDLKCGMRIVNALRAKKYSFVYQVLNLNVDSFCKIERLGKGSLSVFQIYLSTLGLSIGLQFTKPEYSNLENYSSLRWSN